MSQPMGKTSSAIGGGDAPQQKMGQQQSASPGMQPMQNANRSGRFTNLQTILGQNQGLGQQVRTAGQTQLGAATTAFNTAADPLRNASFTANTNWQPLFSQLGNGPQWAQAQTMSNLQGMLNQEYTGPGPMSFDLQGNRNLQNTAALGNATTAGTQLAVGPYSGSANRMDQAMLGGSGEVRGEMNTLNRDREDFVRGAGREQGELNDRVTGFANQAAAARDEVRNGLIGAGNNMLSEVGDRVTARNNQEFADFSGGVIRDPYTGQIYNPAGFETAGGWQGPAAGTGATLSNTANADELGRFSGLNALLGMSQFDIGQQSPYSSGYYEIATNPGDLPISYPHDGSLHDQTNFAEDPETRRQLEIIRQREARKNIKQTTGF